jgi:hypothetical protein
VLAYKVPLLAVTSVTGFLQRLQRLEHEATGYAGQRETSKVAHRTHLIVLEFGAAISDDCLYIIQEIRERVLKC